MSSTPSGPLAEAYTQALPTSKALFERAQKLFPDGVTHDNRRMQPFPLFIDRADGAYKWDADGQQYIDCNEAAIEMLGFTSKQQLLDADPASFYPAIQPDGLSSADKESKMIEVAKTRGELTKGATVFDRRPNRIDRANMEVAVDVDAAAARDYIVRALRRAGECTK